MGTGLATPMGEKLGLGKSHPKPAYFIYINFANTVPKYAIRVIEGG